MPELTPVKKACTAYRADPLVLALESQGLSFDIFAGSRAVTLEHIGVDAEVRGKGLGAQALKRLLEIADAHHVTVDLEVGTDDAGIGLVDWYTRHGFVWKEGFMAREPQTNRATPEENFKAWFGNSQVVDAEGNPKVVYHGTRRDFSNFDVARSTNQGIFFADTAKHAGHYAKTSAGNTVNGSNIMPVYLSLENPFTIDYKGGADQDGLLDAIEQAKFECRDGVVAQNTNDGYGLVTQYVVFDPARIKSSIGNAGAYDKMDSDITDQRARAATALAWLQEMPLKKAVLRA